MGWDGSVPGIDNAFESWSVMGLNGAASRPVSGTCARGHRSLAVGAPAVSPSPMPRLSPLARRWQPPYYLSVSKKATIFVASSSVSPTFGINVPGFSAAGFMIHFLRSSGPELLTAPPAILVRLATPARFGPTWPVAPGTPGIVWQPTHGLVAMSCAPSAAGLPGSSAGPAPAAAAAPSRSGVPPALPGAIDAFTVTNPMALPAGRSRPST